MWALQLRLDIDLEERSHSLRRKTPGAGRWTIRIVASAFQDMSHNAILFPLNRGINVFLDILASTS